VSDRIDHCGRGLESDDAPRRPLVASPQHALPPYAVDAAHDVAHCLQLWARDVVPAQ
jgi:hypothetical protein